MAFDFEARDEARRAYAARPRTPVNLLVVGQSNEQGPVPDSDADANPLCFRSARNPGVTSLSGAIPAIHGGWWMDVHDRLWDHGYDARIINAAVGGASLLTQMCGTLQARAVAPNYYQRRAASVYPDLGDCGDIYQIGGRTFVVVGGGRLRQAFNAGPLPGLVGVSNLQDFIGFGPSTGAGSPAASAPDVSAVPVGGTIVDGGLTLMRLEDVYGVSNAYHPRDVFNLGNAFTERLAGRGFDPLGILMRAWMMLQAQSINGARTIVYFANGQSDLGIGPLTYQRALMCAMTFFLRRGCEVMIGNTIYSPGSGTSTAAAYASQVTGADSAVAELAGWFPGRVHRGANLVGAMGMTGPMGGQKFTGSVAGTTLTVTGLQADSGSGIAAGQTLWNGQAAVGTILPFGTAGTTGTGGTGSYALSAGAAIGSTALVAAGAWLQFDGIHVSAAGCVGPAIGGVASAGTHVANALKAVLPEQRR
ncbi:hypothetical protein [Sphingomonas sp. VNH70]|uniref:hypothetical protein n=1 Tax=Sphingomonas silueang TaxID=3156617 RepID=UPI0032B4ECCE